MNLSKTHIGRVEAVDFPELGIKGIHAKIDTGAYSSAIDCKDIEVVEEDGEEFLHFTLLDPESDFFTGKHIVSENFRDITVRNSFGETQKRYLIKTPVVIGDTKFVTELSLVDRGNMSFPVLLGRKALRNRFIVDVDRRYLVSEENLEEE